MWVKPSPIPSAANTLSQTPQGSVFGYVAVSSVSVDVGAAGGEPAATEFAVQVDGQTVAKKGLFLFPSARKCLEAVRGAIGS